ncbi:MAG: cyclic nucleotide-binding domain-containing protein [Desulfobacteraceae bacterium]|jgi:CRP/FNR family transcriptional regulator
MNNQTEGWEFHLTEMDLFKGLDLNVMGEIADTACTEASYEKGAVIFNEGDSANTLYILYKGAVDLKIGREKTVYRLTATSDIFGWSSLVEEAQYTATANAETDIQVVKIDTRKMNRLFNAHPLFGLTVYRRLSAIFNKRLASIYAKFK